MKYNMKIRFNEETREIAEENKTVAEIFEKEIQENSKRIIACNCNNEIKSLNYVPKENDKITFVDIQSRDGRRTYIRGILYVMSMAFHECYPQALLSINYQLTNAMYCEVDNMEVTQEMIDTVEQKMKEIINANLPIRKIEMTKEEAEKFYEKENTLRGRLQLSNEQKKEVSLYFCKDYYNYFYGVMPITTGMVSVFDLLPYHDGLLLRYPSKQNPFALEKAGASRKLISTLDEYKDIHRVLDVNIPYTN